MPRKSAIILIYYHQEILGLIKTEYNLSLDNLKTPKPVKYSISIETFDMSVV
jgi:hypothetical protein